MSATPRDWEVGRSAQVKEEPAKRAGDTEQSALPSGRCFALTCRLQTSASWFFSHSRFW